MKRMKQKEWLYSKLCCPVCRSDNIGSGSILGPDEYERVCEDCGVEFEELYKPVGYKITGKSSFYPDPDRDEPTEFELRLVRLTQKEEGNG